CSYDTGAREQKKRATRQHGVSPKERLTTPRSVQPTHHGSVLWRDGLQLYVTKFYLHRWPRMGVQRKHASFRTVLVIVVEHDRSDMAIRDVDQDIVLRDNVRSNPPIAQNVIDLCAVVQSPNEARHFTIDELCELAGQCQKLSLASVVASGE